MIKILCVEDNADKQRKVIQAITSVDGIQFEGVVTVSDVHNARRALADTAFDLLILDIALPPRADETVVLTAGLKLLEEIESHGRLLMPNRVVAITGYEEVYQKAVDRFASRLMMIVRYDAMSDDWIGQMAAVCRQVVHAHADRTKGIRQYETELAIICALPTPELAAVLTNGWAWEQAYIPHDNTIYYRAEYQCNGQTRVAHAAAAPQVGMPATAVLAANMIRTFRPTIVAMAGIAAGRRGAVNLGDVIVADPTWDWGSGKIVQTDEEDAFEPAPRQLPLMPPLRTRLELMSRDASALNEIQSAWQGSPLPTRLQMKLGPIASGASVVASELASATITRQQRKWIGTEMEAYGIFAAADGAQDPRPMALVMKSVVDFADGEKDDATHHYGSYTSAHALRVFMERFRE